MKRTWAESFERTINCRARPWRCLVVRTEAERSYAAYHTLLNRDEQDLEIDPSRRGLARELARMTLSVNFYTQWY